ncbi:hypothetical protein HK096_009604, partial [Nowakowskiella sp. JEL0078]
SPEQLSLNKKLVNTIDSSFLYDLIFEEKPITYDDTYTTLFWNKLHTFSENPLQLRNSPIPSDSYFKFGAVSRPYIAGVFESVFAWIESNEFPFQSLIGESLTIGSSETTALQDIPDVHTTRKFIWIAIQNFATLLKNTKEHTNDFLGEAAAEFLITIQAQGILILLGHRQTTGSAFDTLPPCLNECVQSFLMQHPRDVKGKKISKKNPMVDTCYLTVGAKALSKHSHRDEQIEWWGILSGTIDQKNRHSVEILAKLFGEAVWLNIHKLPHNIRVFEIRNKSGYGCRWYLSSSKPLEEIKTSTLGALIQLPTSIWEQSVSKDHCNPRTLEFRGFLEPPMVDGHK